MASIKCKLSREFAVGKTRLSSQGYTEYQIEYQVENQSDEGQLMQKSKWCRFREIKKLHRDLQTLYTQIATKDSGSFPKFPRGSYFGRFDEETINSRLIAIRNLLLFCSKIDYLYGSVHFQQFFMEDFDNEYTQSQNISPSSSSSDVKPLNDDSDYQDDHLDGHGNKRDSKMSDISIASTTDNDGDEGPLDTSQQRNPLGGVWLHKRDDDIESSDEESNSIPHEKKLTDDLNRLTIDEDFSLIDETAIKVTGIHTLDQEKNLIDFGADNDKKLSDCIQPADNSVDSSDIQDDVDKEAEDISVNDLVNELLAIDVPTHLNHSENLLPSDMNTINESREKPIDNGVVDEHSAQSTLLFDPLEISKATEDISSIPKDDPFALFYDLKRDKKPNISVDPVDEDAKDPLPEPKRDTLPNSETVLNSTNNGQSEIQTESHSPSQLEESSKKFEEVDYIYDAAKFIVQAVREESNCNYSESFTLYKEGIRSLLAGVQTDSDSKRRDGVKRKIEFYISHIEKMYISQLAGSEGKDLHGNQELPSSVPTCMNLRLELKDFKVIGVINKVLLAQHFTTEEVFVVKVLHKGPKIHTKKGKKLLTPVERARMRSNSIMKSMGCPFMVKLYRWFETATSLFLLIEHVPMGCLYNSISNYLRLEEEESLWRIRRSNKDTHNLIGANQYTQEKDQVLETVHDEGLPQTSEIEDSVADESEETEESERTRSSTATRIFAMLDNLESNPRKKLPESYIQIWISEIISALSYLHSINIIWKDFGPQNILLDANGHVKITFYGEWEEVTQTIAPENIKRLYCAPEIGSITPPTPASDWWSVGAIMYEMLTGRSLYHSFPRGLHTHTEIHLPGHVSADAQSLVKELLQINPHQRIGGGRNGAEELRSHSFFNGVTWQ
ncbi:uncharacterized protein TRIADDRAFT_52816 [Trichoplax adhaerens]|uniref:Protein kinase domain-containing protein n=1 Tax=Trichoplax adhaerens TaxID=10228 RepID=B3RKL7_TRIAD|nr:hypothetical protein TRIADDRAFT_52816 [Trichoplax adhaerens]EDV29186.1 hypothetical protein TRIADDRAFT_52816 [Trichoplax adhaerens]|eukprot:XP_002108388.1 hypothetical protein TRIADDRAFT_52816 [Trichoplax adhaerens]